MEHLLAGRCPYLAFISTLAQMPSGLQWVYAHCICVHSPGRNRTCTCPCLGCATFTPQDYQVSQCILRGSGNRLRLATVPRNLLIATYWGYRTDLAAVAGFDCFAGVMARWK